MRQRCPHPVGPSDGHSRHYYNQARLLNRQAARFAMTVFQRRLASSTWALLCSFRNRLAKLNGLIDDIQSGRIPEEELRAQQEKLNRKVRDGRLVDVLASKTADEESTTAGKAEEHEESEAEALGAFIATSLAELLDERAQVQELIALAEAVHNSGRESKFERMAALLRAPQYRDQKVIIYTEHRDTLDFLTRRLEAMGYAGQVAYIHGGLGFEERDAQVERFRASHDDEGKGARFFIGTDAAAEGINLQFCGILFNYDVPWNPARLEQRMGRIHRYGQKRDRVAIVNLVAGKTREGKVIKTLLDKLEEIRKQLGSDKVFDVVADLPKLREAMAIEELRRLLPGYVRRYLEHTAPVIGIDLVGDLGGQFFLRPRRRGVLESLLPLLDTYPESARNRFTVYRPTDKRDAIFLHPGEPVFERLSALAMVHARHAALRGAIYTDVSATAPYLLHVARITVVRGIDPGVPAFHSQELIEQKLVALKQFADGRLVEAPVAHLLLLKETTKTNPASVVFLAQSDTWRLAAQEHLHQEVATKLGELQRRNAANRLQETEDYLKRAFDYQESELAAARKRYTDKVRMDAPTLVSLAAPQGGAAALGAARRAAGATGAAGVELERIKQQQRTVAERRTQALLQARREVELIQPGTVEILATALVQPSQDPEDIKARDIEVERIAMEVAVAFEAARGADVRDVSTPPKAKLAGLNDYPGFDLFSKRNSGHVWEERGIEVKGRVGVGEIELTENEWARACNLRDKYWLYAVFDCGGNQPRLFRVQDPFANLIAKARGSVVIGYGDVVRSATE